MTQASYHTQHKNSVPASSPAPLWKRLVAWLYDALVLGGLWLTTGLIVILITPGETPVWLTQMAVLTVTFGYFAISWVKGGQTLGLKAWRLYVVGQDSPKITWGVATWRLIFCVLTLAPLAFTLITAAIDPARRTLYDKLSKTSVVMRHR